MPYCPKCGAEIDEAVVFCPKCGVALRTQQPTDWREQRREWRREWRERRRESREQRRSEKYEKYGRREYVFIGPLAGGLVLLFLGLMSYLLVTGQFGIETAAAGFFVFAGLVVVMAAIYLALIARKHHETEA